MATIQLTTGEVVLIDEDDLPVASQFSWRLHATRKYNGHSWGFPAAMVLVNGRAKCLLLHRLLMGARFGDRQIVDHVNGNVLDARKSNLRFCSHGQNICNQRAKTRRKTSRFHGVYLNHGKWEAQIRANKVRYRIGRFQDEVQAAKAYDAAAKAMHGEFASVNFG